MKFTTAYTPVASVFASMGPNEVVEFFDGFMLNLPYCLDELIQDVWRSSGFEGWSSDFSPESLTALGEWVARQVEGKKLTSDSGAAASRGWIREQDLGDEIKTLIVKVGMYYGQVAVRNNSLLKWELLKGKRNSADYRQPVVSGLDWMRLIL